MLAVYFECMQNAVIAARIYALRYPARRRYNKRTFVLLARNLRTTGSIHRPVYLRRRRARTEENMVNVLAYVEINPHISIRQISLQLGVGHGTVQRILKEHR